MESPGSLVICRHSLEKQPKPTFLTLPREIRDHIYSFMSLSSREPIGIRPEDEEIRAVIALNIYLDLAATCRTIRHEILDIFWTGNRFYQTRFDKDPIPKFLIDSGYLGLIRDLIIRPERVIVNGNDYEARFRLRRQGKKMDFGQWEIDLLTLYDPRRVEEKWEYEEMRKMVLPFVALAEDKLRTDDRITPSVMRIFEEICI